MKLLKAGVKLRKIKGELIDGFDPQAVWISFLSFMLVVVAAHAQTGETSGDNAQRGMQKE